MHHPGLQFSKSKLMLNWKPGNNDATPENDVIPLTISYCGVEIDCTSGAVRPSKDYKTFLHDCRYLLHILSILSFFSLNYA